MDVALLRWPTERSRREDLAKKGAPRLLLVEDGEPAPTSTDVREDWIRVPADDLDVQARIDALASRCGPAETRGAVLEPEGVLRFNGGWVALPPVEARLMSAMLDRFGAVVSREQLAKTGWPEGAPGRNALDVHVLRLRRRIADLDLSITTVRSRGYLLEATGSGSGANGNPSNRAGNGANGGSASGRPNGA